VEGVYLLRRGTRFDGTLHLMPHHLVFSYLPSPPADAPPDAKPPRQKEVWITYPMINYCCLKPCPPILRQEPSIRIRCRDFTYFAFFFPNEKTARDVYDSIRALSCKLGRLDKLLAFSYQPKPPEDQQNGWDLYDARREWKRLGISPKDTEKGWRISEVNVEYKVCRMRQTTTASVLDVWNSTRRHTPPCSSSLRMSRTASSDTPANTARDNAYPPWSTVTP
jgi:myotubularin-related protein 6/7/8